MKAGPDRGRPVEPQQPIEHVASSAALIADPEAGRGRVGRELPRIQDLLRERSIAYRLLVASRGMDPADMARAAIDDGERFLVAVGDNATVNGVLNGMLEADRPAEPDAILGILAANSGCDVVRTFGLAQDPGLAIDRLHSGLVYSVDVGKAIVDAPADGSDRYFLNMAQVGLGGLVAARASGVPRVLRGVRPFLGYWLAMAGFRRPHVHIQGDRREFDGLITNVIVANLQYAASGMHLSPRSWPEDGYFDLQVFTGPRSDSFTLLPKMFVGEHLPHPNILEYRSTRVRIEAGRPVPVEVDGSPVGTTPVTFEVLPRVLRLKV